MDAVPIWVVTKLSTYLKGIQIKTDLYAFQLHKLGDHTHVYLFLGGRMLPNFVTYYIYLYIYVI